jgi:lysyl-tRNA synthetase class 2
LEKANALKEQGQEPYGLRFDLSDRMARLQADHADLPNGSERDLKVSVAGRVMTRRVMGKLAFFHAG